MTIYLLRHGESTGDLEGRFGGTYDDHLSDRGYAQAGQLAEQLVGKDIEIVFTSPYHRAREGAEIIGGQLNVPVEVVDELREHNAYGILSGMVKAEARALHPEQYAKVSERDQAVTGAEPYGEFHNRMENIFRHLASRDHTTIAIVTHGGQIRAFARHLLGKEPKSIGDCAILEIETDGQGFRLVRSKNIDL